MVNIHQILSDNGFKYHYSMVDKTLVIDDLEVVNYEPIIDYIDVLNRGFYVFINFIEELNRLRFVGQNIKG